jgi:hypothetical protein
MQSNCRKGGNDDVATTKIWAINGDIRGVLRYVGNKEKTANQEYGKEQFQSLKDVMDYAVNPEKTEQEYFVSGINCDPKTAREEMLRTKRRFGKLDGRAAYHGYQSFKAGEVTAEVAHEIGVKLAQEIWGDRFQVIVATHCNTSHYHNHFVLNSVSFVDGKKFNSDCKSYFGIMRGVSDRLCREYNISVIRPEKGGPHAKHYTEWQAEREGTRTWRDIIRRDVDEAIQRSRVFPEFIDHLREMGYEIKTDVMHIAVRPPGKERSVRLRSLGGAYDYESINRRLADLLFGTKDRIRYIDEPASIAKHFRCKSSIKRIKPIIIFKGLHALYWRYVYMLRRAAGQMQSMRPASNKRTHFLLREDIRRMDGYIEQFKLLHKNKIEALPQLIEHRNTVNAQMDALISARDAIRTKQRRSLPEAEKAALEAKAARITEQIQGLRKKVKMCNAIEEQSAMLPGRLTEIRRAEQEKQFRRIEKTQEKRKFDRQYLSR